MLKYIIYLSTLSLLINSCTSNDSGYRGKVVCTDIHVKVPLNEKEVIQAEFSEIFWVKLETNNESVFGDVSRLRVGAGRIFILDSENAQGLFVFDLQGKFLFKIDKKGNGPGEFYTANDFFIDTLQHTISIYDANMRNLHYYDWQGKYSRTYNFHGFWPFACCPLDSQVYALDFTKRARRTNRFHLQLVSEQNEALFKFRPLESDYEYANNNHIAFYHGMDRIFYVPVRCDTIFEVSANGISETGYCIDFGTYTLPQKFLNRIRKDKQAFQLLNSKYCYNIQNIVETSDLLCFQYNFGNMRKVILYNKKNQGMYNRPPMFCPIVKANYGEYLVGLDDSRGIIELLKRNTPEALNVMSELFGEKNWSILKSMEENDNPAVCFYKLNL